MGSPPPETLVGERYVFVPTATDPEGDELTFSIKNPPPWANFDSATGKLKGRPPAGSEGIYDKIRITVSDSVATAALPDFSITVAQSANASTTLSWQAPSTNTDGTQITDLAGYKIYYGRNRGSYGNTITIDNPTISSYVVENLTTGTWYFVTTAFNRSGIESRFSTEVSLVVE